MRTLNTAVEIYRVKTGPMGSDASYGNNGMFVVPHRSAAPKPRYLQVIVSDGEGWDHVSVSLPDRCPTWEEMQYVRSLWFTNEEWVVQYSPPKSAHINVHPFCLHLWRKQEAETLWLPVPPAWMIAPVGVT